jgi:hypothetical protein
MSGFRERFGQERAKQGEDMDQPRPDRTGFLADPLENPLS